MRSAGIFQKIDARVCLGFCVERLFALFALCVAHGLIADLEPSEKLLAEVVEGAAGDGRLDLVHKGLHKVDVVDR